MHQGHNDNKKLIFRNTTFLRSYYNDNESGNSGIYGFLFINQSVHATAWHLAHMDSTFYFTRVLDDGTVAVAV